MSGDSTETLTAASPSDSCEDQQLAEVLDRYLASLEEGIPLDVEQLAAEHPHLSTDIRAFAESVQQLHAVMKPLASRDSEGRSLDDSAARRLGDFQLGAEIGRGGMGVVYEARQISLQRKVALKTLPFAAIWDQKQVARFRNEAQAAAQLHHPNIVPVFAVGQERGVHFYAMQYIAGRSLDMVLRELRQEAEQAIATASTLGIGETTRVVRTTHLVPQGRSELSLQHSENLGEYCRAIAELGIQAAEALEYAHQCGVVHRDVKPSNLLVDHQGKLWVTDFGLARVRDNPGVTVTGDVVGTLRYMSPEQATGQHALVDPRSDVYSLGASLYELLTLQAAHPGENRQQVLHFLAEREPVPPRELNSAIPVDLETIVLQAMAKSRDDRYASARELADDLNRFLEGKPTQARRPTVLDRSSKWVRRHRVLVMLAAVFLVALTVVSTTGAVLLSQQHAKTQEALTTAEGNLKQARQVVDRFGSQFAQELSRLPGSEPLRQAVLVDTLAYYQEFLANAADDPSLQQDLATTHLQAGAIASRLGKQSDARDSYQAAYDLFETLYASDRSPEWLAEQAQCLNGLALLESAQGKLTEGLHHYQRAIQKQSQVVSQRRPEDSSESVRQLAEMLTNEGLLHRQAGEVEAARTALNRAIELLRTISASCPDETRYSHDLAIALNNRSFIEQESDWTAAETSCNEAVKLLLRLIEEDEPQSPVTVARRSDLALSYNNLGAIHSRLGRYDDAHQAYQSAVAIQEQLLRQEPAVVEYRSDLAVTCNNLGQVLAKAGRPVEADEAYARSEELFAHLVSDYPSDVRFRSSLAGVLNNRAMAGELNGELEQALVQYTAAIEHQRFAVEQAPRRVEYREFLSKHYFNFGRALRIVGRPAEAAQAALDRRDLWPEEGERLMQVALELAEAAELMVADESTENDTLSRADVIREARATLNQAAAQGVELTDALANQPAMQKLLAQTPTSTEGEKL